MPKNEKLINLIIKKYLDKIQLIVNNDIVVIEYMHTINGERDVYKTINGERDVYKTIEVTEIENNKYSLKIYPEATTKIITLDEFQEIFEILEKQVIKKRLSQKEIENIKNKYKIGTKIYLIKMYDLYAPPLGTIGIVTGVDDDGHILMNWYNGSSLSLVVGIDQFKVLSILRTEQEIQLIKDKYKIGSKIKMNKFSNRPIPRPGLLSTIEKIDEFGNIIVRYKTLGTETLVEGLDDFEIWEE